MFRVCTDFGAITTPSAVEITPQRAVIDGWRVKTSDVQASAGVQLVQLEGTLLILIGMGVCQIPPAVRQDRQMAVDCDRLRCKGLDRAVGNGVSRRSPRLVVTRRQAM